MSSPHSHDDEEEQPIHHDESNWLVSYADMMTLLFGFFVLMYSMSRVDNEKFSIVSRDVARFFGGKVKDDAGLRVTTEDIKDYFMTIMKEAEGSVPEDKLRPPGTSASVVASSETSEDGQEGTPEKQIETDVGVNSLTLKFRGSILFQSGSAQIKPEFEKMLNDLSQKLKASQRVQEIRVEGHTDDQPLKSMIFPTNWELSAARASRVVRQFEANGLGTKHLVAEGYGASEPEAPNRDKAGQRIKENQAKNRRVVVHVIFTPAKTTAKADEATSGEYFEKVKKAEQQPQIRVGDTGAVGDAQNSETDVERRIAEAKTRLDDAKRKLKEKDEAAKKQKKLEDLEHKLDELNKKASDAEGKVVPVPPPAAAKPSAKSGPSATQ